MTDATSWIKEELLKLNSANLSVKPKVLESAVSGHIVIDGEEYLNFASNNYLGLADNPDVKSAAKEAIDIFGVGPAAVRTIAGTTVLHTKLEEKLADFKKAEDCIVFQSGFMANIAVIPALVGENDVIFSDELNHASIIDACKLTKAEVVRYSHCDVKSLEKKLTESNKTGRKLIISDGVFSMDGDIAPLDRLVEVAEKYGAMIMVDDAHGEGVLGTNGRGIVDHFGLHGRVDVEIGTLSKAFGVIGGTAAGKKTVVDWLRQRARPFLFSSAMTIPDTAACIKAVEILAKSDSLVKKLWSNSEILKNGLNEAGFNTGNSQTPIVPVMLGDEKLAKDFSKALFDNKLFAVGITFPTVPLKSARVRTMNSAAHSKEDLTKAIEIFTKVGKELGVI